MPGHYARAIRLTASYAAGDSILCYAPWHCMLSRAALYANGKIIVCHAGRGLAVSPAPHSLPPVTDDGITQNVAATSMHAVSAHIRPSGALRHTQSA